MYSYMSKNLLFAERCSPASRNDAPLHMHKFYQSKLGHYEGQRRVLAAVSLYSHHAADWHEWHRDVFPQH